MAISGLTPINALPTNALVASSSAQVPQFGGIPLNAASTGVVEKPGLLTRVRNAMRSAIGELRGSGSTLATAQSLAMQASAVPTSAAPVSVSKPKVNGAAKKPKFPNAKTWKDKAGNVRQVGTGKIIKRAPGSAAAAPQPAVQQPVVGAQLPTNATQLPGATVYSYDQNGNPVAPTMQQLGMTPTMLQGMEGLTGGIDPSGPQMNATNQNNLGLGTGLMGLGSSVPVIGQPIGATTQPATGSGTGTGSSGGTQSVTNENVNDNASNTQGYGYGMGLGLPFGGVATPAAPYGASMLGNTASRWF